MSTCLIVLDDSFAMQELERGIVERLDYALYILELAYQSCIEISPILRECLVVQRRDWRMLPGGQPHGGLHEAAEVIQGISLNRKRHLQLQ